MQIEYRVVAINGAIPREYEEHLNNLGVEGWDCFAIEHGLGYFKRVRTADVAVAEQVRNEQEPQ